MEHNNNANANAALDTFRASGYLRLPHNSAGYPRALVTLPSTGGDFLATLLSATVAHLHNVSSSEVGSLPFSEDELRPAIVAGVEYRTVSAHLVRTASGEWAVDRYTSNGAPRLEVRRAGYFSAEATTNGQRKVGAATAAALASLETHSPEAFLQADLADALGDVQRTEMAVQRKLAELDELRATLAEQRARYDASRVALRPIAKD
jgi:hypothetical protein